MFPHELVKLISVISKCLRAMCLTHMPRKSQRIKARQKRQANSQKVATTPFTVLTSSSSDEYVELVPDTRHGTTLSCTEEEWEMVAAVLEKDHLRSQWKKNACPYGSHCNENDCVQTHPNSSNELCSGGINCSNLDCPKVHPPESYKKERGFCEIREECPYKNCPKCHIPKVVVEMQELFKKLFDE